MIASSVISREADQKGPPIARRRSPRDPQALAETRRRAIAEQLRTSGAVTVGEVEERFGVSPVTARRDLAALERRGAAHRTHGGAVLPTPDAAEGSRAPAGARTGHARDRLAAAAVALLAPGDSVFLDSSAQSVHVARRILAAGPAVTVITNSVRIMHAVLAHAAPGSRLVGLGGTLRRETGSFVGPMTVGAVGEHFADRLFLGVAGVTAAGVLTEADVFEAEVKRAMLAHAAAATLLLDSAAPAGHALIALAGLTQLTEVLAIGAGAAELELLRTPGVTVVAV
jgi:DeoR/GlpR family transcriptional regulator of sugar metabolism